MHRNRSLTTGLARAGFFLCLLPALVSCTAGDPAPPGRVHNAAPVAGDLGPRDPDRAHRQLFVEERFPSAEQCGTCHPRHYREWSASPHAYAQLSPVFNAMHGTVLQLTNGTTGDFCIRCHSPVGMALGEPLFVSNLDRHPTSREGITCIVCHRVNRAYGKVSGRRALTQASILEPVYGPSGGSEVRRIIESGEFRVRTTKSGDGRPMHSDAVQFLQLVQPGFCGSCHDVTLPDGFRLEEAFSEYKGSPAADEGVTCQDCHMGIEPGIPSGYARGPAAKLRGIYTRPRRITSHRFVGPDYSVVHPGIYPHNPEAQELATLEEWLEFDHEAGWGSDEFEENLVRAQKFPERWRDMEERYEAREILDRQLALLQEVDEKRLTLLRHGYKIGGIVTDAADRNGIQFRVEVLNGTTGHNVPTGFTTERLVFLRVTVRDAEGRVVMRSGDLDPNGDVRDSHSLYVHNGELSRDEQLFSLQSRFITRNIRGGEREQVLSVNTSLDALPFLRPETFASVLTGRPGGVRIHKLSIEPGGHRWAHYQVSGEELGGAGPYRAKVELVAGMVPVNLVNAIKGVGFDYGLSARAIAARIVAGHQVLWARDITFDVE